MTPTDPTAITRRLLIANVVSLAIAGAAYGQATPESSAEHSRLEALQQHIQEQTRRLEGLRLLLGEQEGHLTHLQQELDHLADSGRVADSRPAPAVSQTRLEAARATGRHAARTGALTQIPFAQVPVAQALIAQSATSQAPLAGQPSPAGNAPPQPVGRAPEDEERPPAIAQIFETPGVLTPRGRFVLEPSLQFGYSASDRVALVGYTIIPAILIGLIDVRQIKTTSATAALTARYGLTSRLELEARVPYVYVNGDTVSREIFTGSSVDNVFNASGRGLGDVELSARYQLNQGGADRPYYVGWLRYKSRTGTDPFEVVTDCVTRCIGNTTGTGLPLELPTGSGFSAIQPGLTWLYPSDPVVLFGSFSYLHNFKRSDVSRTVRGGVTEPIGEVEPGDILGFNVGMGLALNDKTSVSLGYDQSIVGRTRQNGQDAPGSVRVVLGTLMLGGSYRFSEKTSLNLALGVGVTRDTPDMTLTARVPVSF